MLLGIVWSTNTLAGTYLNLPTDATPVLVGSSSDGSVIVGYYSDGGNLTASRWDDTILTILSPISGAWVIACSLDASIIVGMTSTQGVYWSSGGTVTHTLPTVAGATATATNDCSDDGTVIVGTAVTGDAIRHALYWTNGVLTELPNTLNVAGSSAFVLNCSNDGSILAGHSFGNNEYVPCYWSGTTQYPLDMGGATSIQVYGITGDGSTIYGTKGFASNFEQVCYWDNLHTSSGGVYGTLHDLVYLVNSNLGNIDTIGTSANVVAGRDQTATHLFPPSPCLDYVVRWTNGTSSPCTPLVDWQLCQLPLGFLPLLSGDGTIIAGSASTVDDVSLAVFWDGSNNPHILQVPESAVGTAVVRGTSRDGSTIYGWAEAPTSPPATWIITSSLQSPNAGGVGDVWMDDSYVDFSDATTRSGFENANGSWKDPGQNGENYTGSSPLNFLTVQPGNPPSDILFGYGQSGLQDGWNLQEDGVDPTTGDPYPDMSFDDCDTVTVLQLLDIEIYAVLPDDPITLRWSDTAGASWSEGILKSMGRTGEYLTSPTWYRLGMSRNRVFEISWSGARASALQGVWVDVSIAQT